MSPFLLMVPSPWTLIKLNLKSIKEDQLLPVFRLNLFWNIREESLMIILPLKESTILFLLLDGDMTQLKIDNIGS